MEIIKAAELKAEDNETFRKYKGTESHHAALYGSVSVELAIQIVDLKNELVEIKKQQYGNR